MSSHYQYYTQNLWGAVRVLHDPLSPACQTSSNLTEKDFLLELIPDVARACELQRQEISLICPCVTIIIQYDVWLIAHI